MLLPQVSPPVRDGPYSTGFYYASSPGPYNTGYTGLATPLFSIDSPSSVPEPTVGTFLFLGGLILVARAMR